MELVKKEKRPTFPVAYDDHMDILEQCDTLQGHFEVLLFALQGMIKNTGGDNGHLKALESVTSNARDSFYEILKMIEDMRKA